LRDCLEFNVEGTEKKDNFNINSKEMEWLPKNIDIDCLSATSDSSKFLRTEWTELSVCNNWFPLKMFEDRV
jgi:hypothetical protein